MTAATPRDAPVDGDHASGARPTLTFLGAAGTVTGSLHMLAVGDKRLLVDCGMYQGRRAEARQRNENLPAAARDADALILTHAHIDHSGMIPRLVRQGFSGPIFCTKATWDLCRYMLHDSARIQVHDAKWLNRKFGDEADWETVEPLYEPADVDRALELFSPQRYQLPFSPLPGVSARLLDAGHILGSATALCELDEAVAGRAMKIAFSGDIGRRGLPILRDPTPPAGADYVVMESTYGDRMHSPASDIETQLAEAIRETAARGGKVLIPSFALERTQEIVYALNRLFRAGQLPEMAVFVDSPLAVDVTTVFRRHTECYDQETSDFDRESGDPFGFPNLALIQDVEQSKRLNAPQQKPCVIISPSGMCEFGRIVHHLRNGIEDDKNTVLIVGYQAQHTLGRRLVEGRSQVKIFGVARDVRCRVKVLDAFSAHADRDELLWWADSCGEQVKRFFCVHGDEDQTAALVGHLEARGRSALAPTLGQSVTLD
jgi:metallo-beta-lactamase family protein